MHRKTLKKRVLNLSGKRFKVGFESYPNKVILAIVAHIDLYTPEHRSPSDNLIKSNDEY